MKGSGCRSADRTLTVSASWRRVVLANLVNTRSQEPQAALSDVQPPDRAPCFFTGLWRAAGPNCRAGRNSPREIRRYQGSITEALDINNSGQVAGSGLLDGVPRGFVLTLATLEIAAVPLAPGATSNEAWNINDLGDVIGRANDGIAGGGPFPQGGWGYFWGGPGTLPQLLPSTTNGAAMPRAINNLDELAGDCAVTGADISQEDLFMSLWQPDQEGVLNVTDLGSQIPAKPTWYLRCGFGINEDGWIAGTGRKFAKGRYTWQGVLLVPNP